MKLVEATVQYVIKKMPISNKGMVENFTQFYNESGQTSRLLTPMKLKQRIGTRGMLWGLYERKSNTLIGTIGLKHMKTDENLHIGEIGYVMVAEAHRTVPNVQKLFKIAMTRAKQFDAAYITNSIKNKAIDKILIKTPKIDKTFEIKAPKSGMDRLYVYSVNNTSNPNNRTIIEDYFQEYIVREI